MSFTDSFIKFKQGMDAVGIAIGSYEFQLEPEIIYPPEFGSPYILELALPGGETIQTVGLFLFDEDGGQWYIHGPTPVAVDLHNGVINGFSQQPLMFCGYATQTVTSLSLKRSQRHEFPIIYNVINKGMAEHLRIEGSLQKTGIMFGHFTKDTKLGGPGNTPVFVAHGDLLPLDKSDEDSFKRSCPVCDGGILMMRRDPKTFDLLPDDNCIKCGQPVIYTDFKNTQSLSGQSRKP